MMKFQGREVLPVTTIRAFSAFLANQPDLPLASSALLSGIRLMPIIGVVVLALSRTESRLPSRQFSIAGVTGRHGPNISKNAKI